MVTCLAETNVCWRRRRAQMRTTVWQRRRCARAATLRLVTSTHASSRQALQSSPCLLHAPTSLCQSPQLQTNDCYGSGQFVQLSMHTISMCSLSWMGPGYCDATCGRCVRCSAAGLASSAATEQQPSASASAPAAAASAPESTAPPAASAAPVVAPCIATYQVRHSHSPATSIRAAYAALIQGVLSVSVICLCRLAPHGARAGRCRRRASKLSSPRRLVSPCPRPTH